MSWGFQTTPCPWGGSSQERQLTNDQHDGVKVGHCPRIRGQRWFSGRSDTQTLVLRMNRIYPGGGVVERERERERSRIGKGVPGGGNSINEGPGICWEAETLGELEHQEGEGGATGKVTHLNSEYSEGWARWGGSVETVDLSNEGGQILLLFPRQVLNCLLCVLVAQSCPTLCDPMDCSPPGSSVHGIYQTRILQLVAIPFYRVSSQPRDETRSPVLQVESLPSEPPGKSLLD